MTDRTNRHKSSNGEEWGGSMGEYRKFGGVRMVGEWGNFLIFGCWRSWVMYGGNMEEVGKCVGAVKAGKRRCVGGVGSVGKYGEVWGVGVWKYVWGVGKCVWGEVWKGCWGGGKGCEKVWGVGVWKCVWGVEKCL